VASEKYKKSGASFKGIKETEFNLKTVLDLTDQVAAGTITLKEAYKEMGDIALPGILDKTKKLNELTSESEKTQKGLLQSFKAGLGFSLDSNKIKKIEKDLSQAILDDDTQRIQLLTEMIDKQSEMNEDIKTANDGFEDMFPGIVGGIKKMQGAMATFNAIASLNPLLALATVILAATMYLISLVKGANDLRAEFGGSLKHMVGINFELQKASLMALRFGLSSDQIKESFSATANTFGEISKSSVAFSADMARVARNSGLTATQAVEMVALFQGMAGGSKEVALSMIESVTKMAELTGLSSGVILGDLAENADLFASYIGDGVQNLIAAEAAAKKVGASFTDLVDLGDGLLDITDRINKEQMLSAMLGREVNLERAAMLHAQGDELGYQQEIASMLEGMSGLNSTQVRLFTAELGLATSTATKLAGLSKTGMGSPAQTPGQNPYEQARYKQGEQLLRAVNHPQYAK
jgi:hypothetical protein